MPTYYLDPSSDITTNLRWTSVELAFPDLWVTLSDGIIERQPTLYEFDDTNSIITSAGTNITAEMVFGFDSLFLTSEEVTSLTVWVYCRSVGSLLDELQFKLEKSDGTVLADSGIIDTLPEFAVTAEWFSVTYTGFLNESDLDGIRVRLLGTPLSASDPGPQVDQLYIEVSTGSVEVFCTDVEASYTVTVPLVVSSQLQASYVVNRIIFAIGDHSFFLNVTALEDAPDEAEDLFLKGPLSLYITFNSVLKKLPAYSSAFFRGNEVIYTWSHPSGASGYFKYRQDM